MKYKYAFKSDKENVVKVVGRDLGISTRNSIEICSHIKGMEVKKARNLLEKVIKQEAAIPFKRFTEGAGHKKGMGSAKYPLRASQQFLFLLKALEANAQNKGLSSELKIIHACAQKAAEPLHYGRKRRIKMKRTHVEIAAEEIEASKRKLAASEKINFSEAKKGKETSKQKLAVPEKRNFSETKKDKKEQKEKPAEKPAEKTEKSPAE
jgi:large subunit ribosomal protein L22